MLSVFFHRMKNDSLNKILIVEKLWKKIPARSMLYYWIQKQNHETLSILSAGYSVCCCDTTIQCCICVNKDSCLFGMLFPVIALSRQHLFWRNIFVFWVFFLKEKLFHSLLLKIFLGQTIRMFVRAQCFLTGLKNIQKSRFSSAFIRFSSHSSNIIGSSIDKTSSQYQVYIVSVIRGTIFDSNLCKCFVFSGKLSMYE